MDGWNTSFLLGWLIFRGELLNFQGVQPTFFVVQLAKVLVSFVLEIPTFGMSTSKTSEPNDHPWLPYSSLGWIWGGGLGCRIWDANDGRLAIYTEKNELACVFLAKNQADYC